MPPQSDLVAAITANDAVALQAAIGAGADVSLPFPDPTARGPRPTTALIHCAEHSHPELLRILLEGGADPDTTDRPRGPMSALRAAVLAGDPNAVEVLLAHRATVGHPALRQDVRVEALSGVLHHPSPAALRVLDLLTAASGVEPASGSLLLAAVATTPPTRPVIELLVRRGAAPDSRRTDGTPALVVAARHDHLAAVDALLAAGASPDLPDPEGRTALWYAADHGWLEVAASLCLAGADPNHEGPNGATPLDLARYWGDQRLQRTMGLRNTVPRPVRARSGALRFFPRGWTLVAPDGTFEELARLVEHAIDEMGGDYKIVVGAGDDDLVGKLRTVAAPVERLPGVLQLRLSDREYRTLTGTLLQYSGYPKLEPPDGFDILQVRDLEQILRRAKQP